MLKWVKTSESLPPFHKRVLCWEKETNLFDWDMNPVHVFLYARSPASVEGNNHVPYRWDCENSGFAFGQDVEYWAEMEGPNV
jgi:hypothetical protein